MKQRNHIRRFLPVALLLALVLTCGSVFAYMFYRTEAKSIQFTPAVVDCEVHAPLVDGNISSVKVENTGNIPAYLRVRLVAYWVDGDNNVAPKTSPTLTVSYDGEKWVKSAAANTFYFKEPVDPDAPYDFTTNLLTAPPTLDPPTMPGYTPVVDVFAEAIQASPTAAVTGSWHVTLDGVNIATAP